MVICLWYIVLGKSGIRKLVRNFVFGWDRLQQSDRYFPLFSLKTVQMVTAKQKVRRIMGADRSVHQLRH